MGSSTEHSAWRTTVNPWDLARVPGGSSGGSAAAAVAAGCARSSLGTDTGGSIRQPAAFCGVVGLKPTYGRVSRWGAHRVRVVARSDRPAGRTVEDAALLLETIAGHDPRDATSRSRAVPELVAALARRVRAVKIGLPEASTSPATIDPTCACALERAKIALRDAGAILVDISLPHTRSRCPRTT
jgi:aspartyl-tRNA(Asn)/glutamyl-tRNA(Gln) amidotransferase subunit A